MEVPGILYPAMADSHVPRWKDKRTLFSGHTVILWDVDVEHALLTLYLPGRHLEARRSDLMSAIQ